MSVSAEPSNGASVSNKPTEFEETLTGTIDGVFVTSKKVTSVCVDGWVLDMRITTLPPKGTPLSYSDKLFYCPILPSSTTKATREYGSRSKDDAMDEEEEEEEEEEVREDVACFASSLSFLPIREHPGYTHVQMQRKKGNGRLIWKLVNRQPRTTLREGLRVRNPPAKAPSLFSSSSSSLLSSCPSSCIPVTSTTNSNSSSSASSSAKRKRSEPSTLPSQSGSLVRLSCMGDISDLLPSSVSGGGGGSVLQL